MYNVICIHLYYHHSLVYMACFSFIDMDIQVVSYPYNNIAIVIIDVILFAVDNS